MRWDESDLTGNIQTSVLTEDEECSDGLDPGVMKCSNAKSASVCVCVVFPSAAPLHLSRFIYIPVISEVREQFSSLSDGAFLPDWLQLWGREWKTRQWVQWKRDRAAATAGFNIHLVLHHLQSAECVFRCILRNENTFFSCNQNDWCKKSRNYFISLRVNVASSVWCFDETSAWGTALVFHFNTKRHSQPILLLSCQVFLSEMGYLMRKIGHLILDAKDKLVNTNVCDVCSPFCFGWKTFSLNRRDRERTSAAHFHILRHRQRDTLLIICFLLKHLSYVALESPNLW